MKVTVTIDDDLMRDAQRFTGITEKSSLIRHALKSLVQREAARRLSALGT
jgi:Arc/MetJ family transcription regulator